MQWSRYQQLFYFRQKIGGQEKSILKAVRIQNRWVGHVQCHGTPSGHNVLASQQYSCTHREEVKIWLKINKNLLIQKQHSPMWVKRGALLMIWTRVAFTGTERKAVYTETEDIHRSHGQWHAAACAYLLFYVLLLLEINHWIFPTTTDIVLMLFYILNPLIDKF